MKEKKTTFFEHGKKIRTNGIGFLNIGQWNALNGCCLYTLEEWWDINMRKEDWKQKMTIAEAIYYGVYEYPEIQQRIDDSGIDITDPYVIAHNRDLFYGLWFRNYHLRLKEQIRQYEEENEFFDYLPAMMEK